MNPGAMTNPRASIVSFPRSSISEISRIFPPEIPTLRTASKFVSGSFTGPCSITTSKTVAAPSAASGLAENSDTANATAIIHFVIRICKSHLGTIALPQAHQSLRESSFCQKKNPGSLGVSDPGWGYCLRGAWGKVVVSVNLSCHLANLPQLFVGKENLFLIAGALFV